MTLSTHVNFSIFDFKSCKLRIVSFSVKFETGVYVSTKKSFDPYLLFISLNYFKSLSPSKRSASDEASKLKFFALYNEKIITKDNNRRVIFEKSITIFL